MRILIIGAGGVGTSAALIATRRGFFESCVVADYDLSRAEGVVSRTGDPRFLAAAVDASDAEAVTALCLEHGITHVLNVVDPRFVMPIFTGDEIVIFIENGDRMKFGDDGYGHAIPFKPENPTLPYQQTPLEIQKLYPIKITG